jgi:hypothetical protein
MLIKVFFAIISIAAQKEIQLDIPPVWDEEGKSIVARDAITVNQVDNLETCEFAGGKVQIVKSDEREIHFRAKEKSGCSLIRMSKEDFSTLDPLYAKNKRQELELRLNSFQKQLDQDLEKVLKSRGEDCLPEGKGLKMGNVYKMKGNLYRYHSGTEARELGGKSCQVESDSLMEMVGFDRTGEFAVAVFRRAKDSKGVVPFGRHNQPAAVCKDDARLVVPVAKLKNFFSFDPASKAESLSVTGLMALFKQSPKSCDPSQIGNEAAVSSSKKAKNPGSKGEAFAPQGEDTTGAQ